MAKNSIIQDWLNQEVSSPEREEMERVIAMTERMDVPSGSSKTEAWDKLLSKIDLKDEKENTVETKNDPIGQWLNQEIPSDEKEEMERIIALTENMVVPSNTSKSQAWEQLLSKIDQETDNNERVLIPDTGTRRSWITYVAAAAAVLLLGIYVFLPSNAVTLSTGAAEQQAFTLPDNSMVTLNANSSITYNKKNWAENRALDLTGEGFFEVQSGSDFKVNTERGIITVIGTAFNVKDRNETLEVSCFEGKVSVSSLSDQNEVLTAGMQATILQNSNRSAIGSFDPNQTATWRIGEFYFNEANLASAIEELERQFNITIDVSVDIEYRTYSGYFDNQNLIEALQLVFTPMGLQFEIDGKKVMVR